MGRAVRPICCLLGSNRRSRKLACQPAAGQSWKRSSASSAGASAEIRARKHRLTSSVCARRNPTTNRARASWKRRWTKPAASCCSPPSTDRPSSTTRSDRRWTTPGRRRWKAARRQFTSAVACAVCTLAPGQITRMREWRDYIVLSSVEQNCVECDRGLKSAPDRDDTAAGWFSLLWFFSRQRVSPVNCSKLLVLHLPEPI